MTTPYSIFQNIKANLTPLLKTSKFLESGVLTPEEFVLAGSYLVYKCPTWSWKGGNDDKKVAYLPGDKQYLVSHHVPSLKRVKDMHDCQTESQVSGVDESDIWTDIKDSAQQSKRLAARAIDDDDYSESGEKRPIADNVPDMDDSEDDDDVVDMAYYRPQSVSSGTVEPKEKQNVVKTRTYSIYITYDKAYQVPRFWLSGFNEDGTLLSSQEILQDISQDHANKTVTIEQFLHEKWTGASIHPCKHAAVMQTLLQKQNDKEPISVEAYLIYFLKFMNSVVPTIDYDFTV